MADEDESTDVVVVRDRLVKLQHLKEKLDAFDAEIGKLVPRAEAMLDSLRLGVPIALKMEENDDGWASYLEFTKIGKNWRLAIVEGVQDGNNEWNVTPLSDVARDRRADVFEQFLPGILDTAVSEMEKRVNRREKAIASTKSLVDTVNKFVDSTTSNDALGKFKADDDKPLLNAAVKAVGAVSAAVIASAAAGEAKKGNTQRAAELMAAAKIPFGGKTIANAPKKAKE